MTPQPGAGDSGDAHPTPDTPEDEHPAPSGLVGRALAELKRHPYAWIITLAFGVAGGIIAPLLFPDFDRTLTAALGAAFGMYAALNAVVNRFLG